MPDLNSLINKLFSSSKKGECYRIAAASDGFDIILGTTYNNKYYFSIEFIDGECNPIRNGSTQIEEFASKLVDALYQTMKVDSEFDENSEYSQAWVESTEDEVNEWTRDDIREWIYNEIKFAL